jgi:PAS domain S-box-containing protein
MSRIQQQHRWSTVSVDDRDQQSPGSVPETLQHSDFTLQVFEESNDAFIVFKPSDGLILEVNATAQRLSGRPRRELIDQLLVDVVKTCPTSSVSELLDTTRQTGFFRAQEGYSFTTPDGSVVPLNISASRIHTHPEPVGLLIARDISEHIRMQQQLREKEREIEQATRLSALGELAAGLVHEIRQPLCAISNFSEVANEHLQRGDHRLASGLLERIIGEAFRCNRIIGQIQAFAKNDTPDYSRVDIHHSIIESLQILDQEVSRSRTTISLDFDDTLPSVQFCEIHLQQVIINLVLNAIEAMENTKTANRKVSIATSVHDEIVEILVSDTGPGVPASFIPRLFQPFQTTRSGGMGMGLAISRRLITASRGSLELVTSTVEGTEFRITIPNGELNS